MRATKEIEHEKRIHKMTLHETIILEPSDTMVLRVFGGWIYTQYHPYNVIDINGQYSVEYRPTATFVPFNGFREED
jgi:hypothetical protein